jgi:hypothetical protein
MRRKLVFLPSTHSKTVVETINGYFNKGYEIEDILNADDGYYLFLYLKNNECYSYKCVKNFDSIDDKQELIEEVQTWVSSNTQDIKPN